MTRPDFRKRGYHSGWDPVAREYKARYPLCLGCWAVGLETPTELIDHIQPLTHDREGLLDPGNLQPCCKWHHDVVKRTLELEWKLGRLPESALRLDSMQAIKLTRDRYPIPVAEDGYPTWEWTQLKRKPYPGGWP